MKLAIWSDLHIGRRMYRTDENNVNKFEQIGYRVLNEYVDTILEGNPDLVINAGDIFDNANPTSYAITNYIKAQSRLSDIPTMTILGNHDFNFSNRKNDCTAVRFANHTYLADYSIKTEIINNILFVMMPYIYDTEENIQKYLKECKDIAESSTAEKKILVTHGITAKYSFESKIDDKLIFPNELVALFDLVIIGHIHTPFAYKQGKTIVMSPGGMIDYQADKDHTGVIFVDTDTFKFERKLIKTPHIIKKECNESNINDILTNVTEDIYHISFKGNADVIDNDLFTKARNKAVNLKIEVVPEDLVVVEEKPLSLDLVQWVRENYPTYVEIFEDARSNMNE